MEDRSLLSTFFVWQFGGSDSFGNGSINAPFQTIQRAVNQAVSGDTIKVAGGVYTYNAATDNTLQFYGTTGVVQVVNKFLTILGGFNPANGYSVSNPAATPSVIDGQGQFRGVFLTANAFGGAALAMDGFTIQNGAGQAIPARGGLSAISGYGGGMLAELSSCYVSNMVFQNNAAFGVNSSSANGGAGAGGGLAAFSCPGTVTLTNVTFTNNTATGANSTSAGSFRGGFGQGGGFFADHCVVSGTNLTFTGNIARGGSSSGSGFDGSETGDGLGGALNVEHCFNGVTLSHVTATNNMAIGGDAPNGLAGGGFGGGLMAEDSNMTLADSNVRNNEALGGAGQNNTAARGSLATGGGINLTNSNLTIDRTYLIANTAQAGNGGPVKGSPTGGGLSLFISAGSPPNNVNMTNCAVTDNVVAYGAGNTEPGGGGGGVSLFGGNATFTQCTFANNTLSGSTTGNLQGMAVIANNPTGVAANISANYSIFANHVSTFTNPAAAIHVFPGNSASFNTNLFAANTRNTNSNGSPGPAGSFSGLGTNLSAATAGFVSPGSPNFNYQITANSAAFHAAVGSTTPVDINLSPRGNPPSLGAFEPTVPSFQFTTSNFAFRQDAGTVAVTVSRTGDTSGSQTVNYSITNGSAINGTNFTATTPGTLTFNPGDTSKSISITLLNRAPDIGTLTFSLNLTSIGGSGGVFGATQSTTVSILSSKGQTIGIFDPSSASWYLRLQNGAGSPDLSPFSFGGAGWRPVVGDWNGDGVATIGVVDPNNTFYLRNANSAGAPDAGVFGYGAPGWVPFSGNWLGTGRSGIGVFDSSSGTWYIRSTASAGAPDIGVFQYGAPGWIPVVGDWTGTGHAGIGVVDPSTNTWYLRSSATPGAPDVGVFRYGAPGWLPVTGDWTGVGHTGIAVVDPGSATWYIRNTASAGSPDFSPFSYGGANWRPVAGSWVGVGGAPMLADSFEPFTPDTSAGLTQQQLDATVVAALNRLQLAGVDPATLNQLAMAEYLVGDMPGTYLGFTSDHSVTISRNAAGRGWFVDPTPLSSEEFDASGMALPGTAAQGRMDLLSVVLHEMEHVVGHSDQFSPSDLMYDVLSTGQRRAEAIDAVFANGVS